MTAPVPASALKAFGEQPSAYAATAAMAFLLGHGISAGLVERMVAVPSTRRRLDAELCARLGAAPAALTLAQAHVASLDPSGLTHLMLRAGAVWHAAVIGGFYDGATVRVLVERIGPEFRDAALADLTAHPQVRSLQDGVPAPTLDELPVAIARDGTACMVAWCEAQPRAVGWRILLRLRISSRPGPQHAELGPAIVERLAAAPGVP